MGCSCWDSTLLPKDRDLDCQTLPMTADENPQQNLVSVLYNPWIKKKAKKLVFLCMWQSMYYSLLPTSSFWKLWVKPQNIMRLDVTWVTEKWINTFVRFISLLIQGELRSCFCDFPSKFFFPSWFELRTQQTWWHWHFSNTMDRYIDLEDFHFPLLSGSEGQFSDYPITQLQKKSQHMASAWRASTAAIGLWGTKGHVRT